VKDRAAYIKKCGSELTSRLAAKARMSGEVNYGF
jgi:hypothetical protein